MFIFLVEMGFPHVDQSDLKFLTSGELPALASQSAGITGLSHCTQSPSLAFSFLGGGYINRELRRKSRDKVPTGVLNTGTRHLGETEAQTLIMNSLKSPSVPS